MTREEYIKKVNNSKIDNTKITIAERKYNTSFSDDVKKVLSAINKFTSIDGKEVNVFPLDYINDFTYKDFGIDFNVLRLIPVLDLFDGCYGCYDIMTSKWCIYSISDNIKYSFHRDYNDFILNVIK